MPAPAKPATQARRKGPVAAHRARRRIGIDSAIQKIVDRAPDLTEEQCDRLRSLLNSAPLPPR
jgi:hypothetical protein